MPRLSEGREVTLLLGVRCNPAPRLSSGALVLPEGSSSEALPLGDLQRRMGLRWLDTAQELTCGDLGEAGHRMTHFMSLSVTDTGPPRGQWTSPSYVAKRCHHFSRARRARWMRRLVRKEDLIPQNNCTNGEASPEGKSRCDKQQTASKGSCLLVRKRVRNGFLRDALAAGTSACR